MKKQYFCLDCNSPKSEKGKYCKSCGYKYRKRPKGLKYEIVKDNPAWFKKGNIPWHAGQYRLDLWKENPGYDAIHSWVERWLGLAKESPCIYCGSSKNMQWSNISGEYKRDLSDWQRLCKKCHARYDYEKFGARKGFFE